MNEQLIKRLKSLFWRAGMMGLAATLAFLANNLTGLGLPIEVVGVLGLILGEVSKHLNKNAK